MENAFLSKSREKKNILRYVTLILLCFAILGNLFTIIVRPTSIETKEINISRSGKLYTYLYYYDEILGDPNKDKWLDDIADSFDFVYLLVPWASVHKSNDSLDLTFLHNITIIGRELNNRGCDLVIHVWISSYHPSWLIQFVPELNNTNPRWVGLPETHQNYWTLLYTNLQYIKLVANYFQSQNLSILGFCLDDETQSENWAQHMRMARDMLHEINSSWWVTVMFATSQLYHLAKNLDFLSLDPYDVDEGVAAKIKYAWSLGFSKLSVLLNGMDEDTEESGNRMRRQAWIAWFMGADSIGWWCYNIYWHGYRGGQPNNWFFMKYSPDGPQYGPKGYAVKLFNQDNDLLNHIEAKRLQALNNQDLQKANYYRTQLDRAFKYALQNDFTRANATLMEVIANE
jgi:hypothetical protein